MHSASALLTAAVLGASGGVGVKFLLAGLGEGGWGGPSRLRTPRRARLQPPDFAATRGLSSPQVPAPAPTGWADPRTAPCHPLPHPRPLPRLRRAPAPASSAPPAPGSLQSLRLPPAPSSGAPASFQPGERLGGGSAGQRGKRRPGPWAPQLSQCGRRPAPREPARRERQGRGGRQRGGRRSSSTPVTSGATRLPFLPFPPSLSPPFPLARAKWLWRRHARAGVSRAGENGVHPGRAEAGGQVRGVGGGAPPSTVSAREGGRAAGLPQTCLEKQGARAQATCAPQGEEAGDPTPRNEGTPCGLCTRALNSGKEWGVVRTFLPSTPSPSLCTPP